MTMNYRQKIETYRLSKASTTEAVEWLEKRVLTDTDGLVDRSEIYRVIEYIFYRRNEPALNLALARFGTYVPILSKLYRNGENAIQLAVLTNRLVGPRSRFGKRTAITSMDLVSLLKGFPRSKNKLNAYFENPHIPRDTLRDIISRKKDFEFIDNSMLLHIIHWLSSNEIISAPRDDTFMDGWAEHDYESLFFDLLKLTELVPKDQDWASVLSDIIEKLHLPFIPDTLSLEKISEWRLDESDASPSFWLRHALARKMALEGHREKDDAVNADCEDKAVRFAYYSACKPWKLFGNFVNEDGFRYPSFEDIDDIDNIDEYLTKNQAKVISTCRKLFALDGNEFIEQLIQNDYFWRRAEERGLLHSLGWHLAEDPHSYMDVPNTLRAVEARRIKETPDFFKDDEYIDINEQAPLEDLIKRALENTNETQRRLDNLGQEISGQLENSSTENSLSYISLRIAKIEELVDRPSWTPILVIAGFIMLAVWLD